MRLGLAHIVWRVDGAPRGRSWSTRLGCDASRLLPTTPTPTPNLESAVMLGNSLQILGMLDFGVEEAGRRAKRVWRRLVD